MLLHDRLYELLRRFHALASSQGFVYGIHYGTLLGAVREEAIIPYDDDVDVYIVKERVTNNIQYDVSRVAAQYGLQVVPLKPEWYFLFTMGNFIGFKLLAIEEGSIPSSYADLDGRACIDVFVVQRTGPIYLNLGIFVDEYLDAEAVENPRVYRLGGLYVQGPSNPRAYLARVYGGTWRTPIKDKPHLTFVRPLTMTKWKLEGFDNEQSQLAEQYQRQALTGPGFEMPVRVRWVTYVLIGLLLLAVVARSLRWRLDC